MSNHTPGPWYTKTKAEDRQGRVIAEGTGANIAVTYDPKDAALVAAAPDLLDACRECLTESGACGYTQPAKYARRRLDEINRILSAAIAKAENRE